MRVIEPPDNPRHDPDEPMCPCHECEQIAADEDEERHLTEWRETH